MFAMKVRLTNFGRRHVTLTEACDILQLSKSGVRYNQLKYQVKTERMKQGNGRATKSITIFRLKDFIEFGFKVRGYDFWE